MNYFFMLICFMSLAHSTPLPQDVQKLVANLQSNSHIASVSVDGFIQGLDRLPTCTMCHTVQEAKFKDDIAVRRWYAHYADCRCKEHHELARVAAWCTAPLVAAGTTHVLCHSYAHKNVAQPNRWLETLRLPLMLAATYFATKFSAHAVRPVSRWVQKRADRAAFAACENRYEKEAVIAHLEAVRANYLVACEDGFTNTAQDWQIMSINAYDETQANRASILHVHVQLPFKDLTVEDLAQNLAERIEYLKRML